MNKTVISIGVAFLFIGIFGVIIGVTYNVQTSSGLLFPIVWMIYPCAILFLIGIILIIVGLSLPSAPSIPSSVSKKETIIIDRQRPRAQFCKYCGARIQEDSAFCSKCGSAQE